MKLVNTPTLDENDVLTLLSGTSILNDGHNITPVYIHTGLRVLGNRTLAVYLSLTNRKQDSITYWVFSCELYTTNKIRSFSQPVLVDGKEVNKLKARLSNTMILLENMESRIELKPEYVNLDPKAVVQTCMGLESFWAQWEINNDKEFIIDGLTEEQKDKLTTIYPSYGRHKILVIRKDNDKSCVYNLIENCTGNALYLKLGELSELA